MGKINFRKFSVKPFTLDDKVAKDGLEAVATLTNKEPYYVVGGLAVQSYLPTSCRRPTSDIDLSVGRALNYAEFRNFSNPVETWLLDNGYSVSEGKHSRFFKLEVVDKRVDENRFLIEFSRRNDENLNKNNHILKRELGQARIKVIEGRNSSYVVASPEDIAVPKLARSINSLIRNPYFERRVVSRKPLSMKEILDQLAEIAEFRKGVVYQPGDVSSSEELRFISDLFDIRVLSELAGFNEPYLREAARDWTTLSSQTFERDLLVRSVLPDLLKEL